MTKAAGILFVSPINGTALFLRRTATASDCPGCWDFPGGTAEGDETADMTAARETREEVGFLPEGVRIFHTRTKSGSASGTVQPGVAGPAAPVGGLPDQAGAAAVEPPPPPMGPSISPDVDFTTFIQKVTNEFTPELNDEHDGFCWAPVDSPPEPLHPGCRVALDRLSMNELDVARAIADGRLTSPQRYENVTLWAIRITGTGTSFRPKINEFVHRDGENHLTPDGLARLNGLPVIMKHPKKALLDSKEFRDRIVGTIFLPYVAGDEAWGIAKIYDDEANKLMDEEDLSTSPGVNFSNHKVNMTLRLEDGSRVLVEGSPSLFDHIAICELGVWDKGEEPSGIRSEAREDSAMADKDEDKAKDDAAKKDAAKDDAKKDDSSKKDAAKKDGEEGDKGEDKSKDDSARKDADAGKEPDNNLSHMLLDAVKACTDSVNAVSKRMDAIETSMSDSRKDAKKDEDKKDPDEKGEAERTAADKSKKDEAKPEDKEDKSKTDARADDASGDTRRRIAAIDQTVQDLKGKIMVSDDDHELIANAWARVDDVYAALGKKTPRPMPGETAMQYRRRTIKELRPLSERWKNIDPKSAAFADDAAFGEIETQVLTDAAVAARNPTNIPAGQLRMVEKKNDGHTIRSFFGQPRDWMDSLAGPVTHRATGRFNTDGLGRGGGNSNN